MRQGTTLRAALAALALTPAAGCGGGAADPERAATIPSTPTTPTSSAASTPTSEPWAPLAGPLGRCGPQPARIAGQEYRLLTLRDGGRALPAVTAGRGRTVVVLLHQTDGGGFCGWLDFAERIAGVPGQMALAFDLCGYGESHCAEGSSSVRRQVEQVQLAIDHAERRLRARRIVVVGASMGGSLSVLTAARDRRVDAAVDLSGPDAWGGASVHRRAADVRAPLLVAMADDEGPEEVEAARATAGAAGPGSSFVGAPQGHGYALLQDTAGDLTPIGARVLAWIAGA
jgi:dienelactone hydrolase